MLSPQFTSSTDRKGQRHGKGDGPAWHVHQEHFHRQGGSPFVGDTALRSLGFSEQESSALRAFISEVLGPEDLLIDLRQSSGSSSHPYGELALVLKLSARSEHTWRIIFIDLPASRTEAIGRALDDLVPTLTLRTWPREAVARGDDLFWWDDEAREWRACQFPNWP
jgi:hypothetical protein